MCEYCGLESLPIEFYDDISNDEILEMKINKKSELTIKYDAYSNDSSFSVYRNINFCPMCGRNLKYKKKGGGVIMSNNIEIYYTKTKEDYDQLMDILEYGGYKWIDGSEPTQEHYDNEFPFTVCNDLRNKQLMKFNYYSIMKHYDSELIITYEKWEGE